MLTAVLIAILAGALSTLTGMGGGQLLLLAVAAIWDPLTSLLVTSPAMVLGLAHRFGLYHRVARLDLAGRVLLGAIPGSLLFGALATEFPEWVLRGAMVGMALTATAKVVLGWTWKPPKRALPAMGFGIGSLAATGGGAGLLLGPVMLARGLSGPTYIGTLCACAIGMHIARGIGYASGGQLTWWHLGTGACLAGGIMVGNQLAHTVRGALPERWESRLQLGALLASLAGVLLA